MPTQKLELTWVGKDQQVKIEPRILLENLEKGYGDRDTGNLLIHGDNLLALKALEQEYAGQVKCCFIDPPYNTGSAFEHYDDNLEHSTWLSLMKPRLEIIRNLLAGIGSLWISIDDDESHYLKVLCDEVFGRGNFVANVVWEKKYSPQSNAQWLSDSHDHVLVYAKNKTSWHPNLLPRTVEMDKRYRNPDNDVRGPWKPVDATISLTGGQRGAQFARTGFSPNVFEITTPSGRKLMPANGRCWAFSPQRYEELKADNRLWFGATGNNVPAQKTFLSEVQGGIVAKTIWFRDEVGDNQEAKNEVTIFNSDNVFATPKPERLIERILTLSTASGDLVLDSFLGSGTTAAVAHKMGRRWIGIELGDHCYTHCLPRLKAVVDGEQGGISKSVNWQGGGGFRFCELAPSLLRKDKYGQWVIDERYNANMLAAAMAKHEGFRYSPDTEVYWKQGYSSEKSFIFTTTAHITAEYVDALQQELKNGETLLICASTYEPAAMRFPNIVVKKIPQILFGRCEFGAQGYGLNIITPPDSEDEEE